MRWQITKAEAARRPALLWQHYSGGERNIQIFNTRLRLREPQNPVQIVTSRLYFSLVDVTAVFRSRCMAARIDLRDGSYSYYEFFQFVCEISG